MNNALRAFAVDGASIALCGSHSREKLLRACFRTFSFCGPVMNKGGRFCEIDIDSFRSRMCGRRIATLSDTLLIGEVAYAQHFKPERAPNGINVWETSKPVSDLLKLFKASVLDAQGVAAICLRPLGEVLK